MSITLDAKELKEHCISSTHAITCRASKETGESLIYVNENASFEELVSALNRFAIERETWSKK